MELKYKQEIDQVLKELYRESWMDDQDWEEFKKEIIRIDLWNYELMDKQIEEGVKNGYSVEQQLEVVRKVLPGKQ